MVQIFSNKTILYHLTRARLVLSWATFCVVTGACSCNLQASGKNWKSRKIVSCERSERERERERDARLATTRCSDYARHRNSEGTSWYLENDAPHLRRIEGTSDAGERGSEEGTIKKEAYELGADAPVSSAAGSERSVRRREMREGPSISLIRSPRRPPGFRNAKHLLLLIGQSTRLTPCVLLTPHYIPLLPTNKPQPTAPLLVVRT
jgi:hypothetical protein